MTSSWFSSAVWAALLAAIVTLWAVSVRRPGSVARPSDLVSALTTRRAGRVGMVLLWMFVGWHLFAR